MPSAKEIVRLATPPGIVAFARRLGLGAGGARDAEWEAIPGGWSYAASHPVVKGWESPEILEIYKKKWERFAGLTRGTGPLGIAHESDLTTNEDLISHNTVMSFAYCLALAARKRDAISMLDWGGGIGHYYLFAKSLLPEVEIEYTCKDVPLLAEYGARILPGGAFVSDASCLERTYDFVLASASFQYTEDWKGLLAKFARAARGLLYIACLPTVLKAGSFVFIQRPYTYGYNTEYLAWCLNRGEVIEAARERGLKLVREFVNGQSPVIQKAPERCLYRGFLFRPADAERRNSA